MSVLASVAAGIQHLAVAHSWQTVHWLAAAYNGREGDGGLAVQFTSQKLPRIVKGQASTT